MWESASTMISWPGRVWESTDTRFPIVPEATKSPASLPVSSAASASSRFAVGSSSQTSSPTSARAMASRIAGVGSVTVSERRSTTSCMSASRRSLARVEEPVQEAFPHPRLWLDFAGAGRDALRQAVGRPLAPLGVAVVVGQALESLDGLVGLPLLSVNLSQEVERLRDHQRPRIVLEEQLKALAGADQVALLGDRKSTRL